MPKENDAFDNWCLTAEGEGMLDGRPLPLITIFLHRVCGNHHKRFEAGIDILRAAFEAGAEQERKSPTQNAVGEIEEEK